MKIGICRQCLELFYRETPLKKQSIEEMEVIIMKHSLAFKFTQRKEQTVKVFLFAVHYSLKWEQIFTINYSLFLERKGTNRLKWPLFLKVIIL